MTAFRTQAPVAQKILSLTYPSHEKRILPNGTTLILLPPVQNEVVQLLIYWPSGSSNQLYPYQAKTALSLSLNGTALRTAEQIQDQFDYWGTSLSPNPGLLHSELSIKSTSEYFIPAFQWFVENYSQAAFPQAEMETMQQTTIAGLQRKMTTPKYWSYKESMELLFGPQSAMTSFATPENILSLTSDQSSEFHKEHLSLGSATYFLSGDYSHSDIDKIVAVLDTQNAGSRETTISNIYVDSISDIAEKLHPVENTSQVSLNMVRNVPWISETDMHRISLLNMILGGFFGSRLMQEIREEKGLTYGIGSYIMQTHKGNIWCISGEMNSKNAGLALDETRKILRGLSTDPPKADELERAKRYYSGQLRSSFDGPFAMANKLKNLMVRNYTLQHFDTAMESIWSCSTDDLCQLADNYLNPESFKTVLAGDIAPN
jgi:zinc protease